MFSCALSVILVARQEALGDGDNLRFVRLGALQAFHHFGEIDLEVAAFGLKLAVSYSHVGTSFLDGADILGTEDDVVEPYAIRRIWPGYAILLRRILGHVVQQPEEVDL